ncbi:MAG: hypothetical protein WD491_09680 [Balneolales bacterium]
MEQAHTERVLLDAVNESGLCEVRFGAEAVALEQNEAEARLKYRKNAFGEAGVR